MTQKTESLLSEEPLHPESVIRFKPLKRTFYRVLWGEREGEGAAQDLQVQFYLERGVQSPASEVVFWPDPHSIFPRVVEAAALEEFAPVSAPTIQLKQTDLRSRGAPGVEFVSWLFVYKSINARYMNPEAKVIAFLDRLDLALSKALGAPAPGGSSGSTA